MPRTPDRLITRLGVGLAAGVAAGLLCGTLARVLMRVVTVITGQEGEFSWGGSTFIVLAFVVAAVPGAILAAGYRGRGRWLLLVAMSLFLCLPATSIATEDLSNVGDLSAVEWLGAALGTVAIYVVILGMPVLVLRLISAWSGSATPDSRIPVAGTVGP